METASLYFTTLATADNLWYLTFTVIGILVITFPVLGAMAYTTWFERKILGWMHLRHGPTENGIFGLLQPIADAVKLMFKEAFIPGSSNKVMFLLAPMLVFVPVLITWAVMPFGPNPLYSFGIGPEQLVLSNINLGVLYLLAITSIEVYGVLLAGWASNSKYPFLGAVRSGAQMVSYEVSMGLIVLSVILLAGSMNLNKIIEAQRTMWFFIPAFPAFVMFLVSILAETNRHPFDLPEAEAELVAGYNTEYSAMGFALFFLGEYIAMISMSAFTAVMFLGGWLPPLDIPPFNWIPGIVWLLIKIVAILFFFVWARGTLPRYRYDQLMRLGWKVFLPLSLVWLVITAFAVKLLGNFAG